MAYSQQELLLQEILERLQNFFKGKQIRPPRKAGVGLALIIILAIAGFTSVYQVDPEETGVVLRLGRFSSFSDPGLHLKAPFSIDEVTTVKTGRIFKEEFGFRTQDADVRTTYTRKNLEEESLILTGDLNVTDLEWVVQYQIADPFKYVYRIRDRQETIRDVSEAVVRRIVGNNNVTRVLTTGRAFLADKVQQEMQQILNSYDIGIRVVTVNFQDVNPPEKVKAAFNEVNEAEQQKESMIQKARAQYNQEVPKAKGQAKSTVLEAKGYAQERINRAKGETRRFLDLLKEYDKAPQVTRQRLYLETMEKVLPRTQDVYVFSNQEQGALPLLPLKSLERSAQ